MKKNILTAKSKNYDTTRQKRIDIYSQSSSRGIDCLINSIFNINFNLFNIMKKLFNIQVLKGICLGLAYEKQLLQIAIIKIVIEVNFKIITDNLKLFIHCLKEN
jgi:hypothetical protein